jgi:hypothetical protein
LGWKKGEGVGRRWLVSGRTREEKRRGKRAREIEEPREEGLVFYFISKICFIFDFKTGFKIVQRNLNFECRGGERENKIVWLYKIILFIKAWMV